MRHLPGCHIIETRNRQTPVCDRLDEIVPPERLTIRHNHIKTSLRGRHARVLGTPVRHNKSIKAELRLQQSVQGLAVLAGVRVVDTVIRAPRVWSVQEPFKHFDEGLT